MYLNIYSVFTYQKWSLEIIEKKFVSLEQVNRSTALLRSLSSERDRWEGSSESFQNQMSTILGDVLLSTAFMAYAGYFDQHMRQNLFSSWAAHLQEARIKFRPDIARVEVST